MFSCLLFSLVVSISLSLPLSSSFVHSPFMCTHMDESLFIFKWPVLYITYFLKCYLITELYILKRKQNFVIRVLGQIFPYSDNLVVTQYSPCHQQINAVGLMNFLLYLNVVLTYEREEGINDMQLRVN